MSLKFLPYFLCFLLHLTTLLTYAQDIEYNTNYRLGFSALHVGPTYKYATGSLRKDSLQFFNAHAGGISGTIQSSFIQNYLFPPKDKYRLRAGDVLRGEFSLGGISTGNPEEKSGLWIAYKFEFGVGLIYEFSPKIDLGIHFILLRFARDRVSENLSGSGILARLRMNRVVIEGGIDSRRERIGGWAIKHGEGNNNPFHYVAGLDYLISDKEKMGIRYEELGRGEEKLDTYTLRFHFLNSFKLYYGIYF